MNSSLDRALLETAAKHLDTVADRIYESTLLAFDKRMIPRQMEQRAKLSRMAKELRELAES
jgi:hypothetical protein